MKSEKLVEALRGLRERGLLPRFVIDEVRSLQKHTFPFPLSTQTLAAVHVVHIPGRWQSERPRLRALAPAGRPCGRARHVAVVRTEFGGARSTWDPLRKHMLL